MRVAGSVVRRAEFAYRLRISHPQPDFELRVVPSSINIRAGSTTPIAVYALRRDGFAGAIALHLKGAPPGFALDGAVIPAGQDNVRLTLTAPPARIEKPFEVTLDGAAEIQGREVHRTAVPAEDMMQAFFYRHLVPEREVLVQMTAAGPRTAQWRPFKNADVQLTAGETTQVQLNGAAKVRRGRSIVPEPAARRHYYRERQTGREWSRRRTARRAGQGQAWSERKPDYGCLR
jgi:hypothetical protein